MNAVRSVVVYRLCGIQAQAIKMVFADPMEGIGEKKFTYGFAVLAVEINSISPFGIFAREVVLRIFGQVIPLWPKMVVHNVQNDAKAVLMSRIDHATQIVWTTIMMKGCKQA